MSARQLQTLSETPTTPREHYLKLLHLSSRHLSCQPQLRAAEKLFLIETGPDMFVGFGQQPTQTCLFHVNQDVATDVKRIQLEFEHFMGDSIRLKFGLARHRQINWQQHGQHNLSLRRADEADLSHCANVLTGTRDWSTLPAGDPLRNVLQLFQPPALMGSVFHVVQTFVLEMVDMLYQDMPLDIPEQVFQNVFTSSLTRNHYPHLQSPTLAFQSLNPFQVLRALVVAGLIVKERNRFHEIRLPQSITINPNWVLFNPFSNSTQQSTVPATGVLAHNAMQSLSKRQQKIYGLRS
ncbi:hypothetical protein OIO90_004573 [Microbotryomycetes sp. JL221]|nr:hypothetical protein OIO90_004573 [Microbotryomycetes sp. JL221]